MIAVVERGTPGEGSRQVAGVHWVLAGIYGLLMAMLVPILYRAIRTPGENDSVLGVSVTLIALLGFLTLHVVTARGASKQKRWARATSLTIAFLMFVAFPIGTVCALIIFRGTRDSRW